MANRNMSVYLNDHLAGSVLWLEILAFAKGKLAGKASEEVLSSIEAEVVQERITLEKLMTKLDVPKSRIRKASAWLGEKLSELKLMADGTSTDFHLLQVLELLLIGVNGRMLLWGGLAAAAAKEPGLQGLDYENLVQQAQGQWKKLEEIRVPVAMVALAIRQ